VTNHSASGPRDLRGIEIRAHDAGLVRHTHLKGLDIHEINAVSDYDREGSTGAKSFGGLFTII